MAERIENPEKTLRSILVIICFSLAAGCVSDTISPTPEISAIPSKATPTQILFDDFSYADVSAMTANGWIVRSGQGWPGVTGATFRPENVSFVDYPNLAGNRLLRMVSSTDGIGEHTYQTQICHQRKYLEGTYAARIRFSDAPASGPDSDHVVETFYMITPYDEPLNPDYSEMDFEYLPNGGWGGSPTTIHFTTWETVQIEPSNAVNVSDSNQGSLAGWHTLVLQVTDGTARYFLDGKLTAQHGGKYYPDAPMSINFNLWFIEGGLNSTGEFREYQEDIDWVFHEAGVSLMPDEINAKVEQFRNASIPFQDTVPPGAVVLESPCDL
jgi:hypothetical protein